MIIHLKDTGPINSFVINLLPNGHVWLYLTGIGRSTLVCDSLIGEEVSMSLKEFDEDGYNFHKTLDAFCRGRLRDYPKAEANFKQYGIPDSLWENIANVIVIKLTMTLKILKLF